MSKGWSTNGKVSLAFMTQHCDFAYTPFLRLAILTHRDVEPRFVTLTKSMHVHAIHVDNPTELLQKMKEFLEYDNSKPMLMDCAIKPNEHVFPMVCGFSHPAGRELTISFIPPGSRWKGT